MRQNSLIAAASFAFVLGCGSYAFAQISDDVVKIGVLTDMTGPASTPTGQGSVTAAQRRSTISAALSSASPSA